MAIFSVLARPAVAFFFSFLSAVVLMPPVRRFAWRVGAVDVPKDHRRMHRDSVARAGGIGIFFAIFITCFLLLSPSLYLFYCLAGGFVLFCVGWTDDLLSLPAWLKLLLEIVVSATVILGGTPLSGLLLLPSVLWVVILTNAHNLIDGLDGLLGGCAAIESLGVALVAFLFGLWEIALVCLILAGACLGFRIYNRYPASIFAGDCGSVTVGFFLGMMSLPLFDVLSELPAILSPFFLFAYPLTDLSTAILRRFCRGVNLFSADKGHLHHRICAAGISQSHTTGILLSLTASLTLIGVLISRAEWFGYAVVAVLACVFLLFQIRRGVLISAQKS